ncbi:MAG: hypothetical protein ACRDG3_07650 [Tepidiformaceae bacterium]
MFGWSRLLALPLLLLVILCGTLVVACGSGGGGGGSAPDQHVSVSLSDSGCTPSSFSLTTGTVVFKVSNVHSTKVDTFSLYRGTQLVAQVTNILGGLSRELTTDLAIGDYTVQCSGGGAGGSGTLTVR